MQTKTQIQHTEIEKIRRIPHFQKLEDTYIIQASIFLKLPTNQQYGISAIVKRSTFESSDRVSPFSCLGNTKICSLKANDISDKQASITQQSNSTICYFLYQQTLQKNISLSKTTFRVARTSTNQTSKLHNCKNKQIPTQSYKHFTNNKQRGRNLSTKQMF